MRVQAEHRAPTQVGRPSLDDPDAEVAVLHRTGEVALLERRPHRGVLALRHPALEDQRLGAAAHAGGHRADEHLVGTGLGERHRADLADAGLAHPERECLIRHEPTQLGVALNRHTGPPYQLSVTT